jgi:hypothetical protein
MITGGMLMSIMFCIRRISLQDGSMLETTQRLLRIGKQKKVLRHIFTKKKLDLV